MGFYEKRAKAFALIKQGILPKSEKEHCRVLGLTEAEYLQHIRDRERDCKIKRDNTRLQSQKRTKVSAEKPILIIGGGPSSTKYIDYIKNFNGKTMVTDAIFNQVLEKDIIPDYIISVEKWVDPSVFFKPNNLEKCRGKTKFIGSSMSRAVLTGAIKDHDIPVELWKDSFEPRMSNVGLFGIYYCKKMLQSDRIFLVGFEHVNKNYEQFIIDDWVGDFWFFVLKWDKETIVNCSQGGVLYYEDYIIDANLKELEIGN